MAFQRRDWVNLKAWAVAGEELARRDGRQIPLAQFQLWQALLARQAGEEARANLLCSNATKRIARLPATSSSFYKILGYYHELEGDLVRALAILDRRLEILSQRGRFNDECDCLVKRCRLLAQMGQPLETNLVAA